MHIYQFSDRSLYEASTSNNNHKIDLKCHKKTLTCNIQGPLISRGVLLCFNPWNHQNEAYFLLQYTVLYCVQSSPVKVNLNSFFLSKPAFLSLWLYVAYFKCPIGKVCIFNMQFIGHLCMWTQQTNKQRREKKKKKKKEDRSSFLFPLLPLFS